MNWRSACAYLWRDRTGTLLGRFSSAGYVWSMQCVLVSGGPIRIRVPTAWTGFAMYLVEWLIDGVDDEPGPTLRWYRGVTQQGE